MELTLDTVSQVVLVVKKPPAIAGDLRDTGSIPGSERLHGGGHGNPLQYFFFFQMLCVCALEVIQLLGLNKASSGPGSQTLLVSAV